MLLAGVLTVPARNPAGLRNESPEAAGQAPKPILEGFTADPAIRVFGDTYYIYPTTDRPNWNTTEFAVWSSKNLVTWKKEGVFMDLSRDLAWATNKAWAPDCIERDGKYYFYFCANHNIGVAIGDTPVGPFKDALGRPLIEDAKIKTFSIDPHAFIDDDGQAYLYFGNGTPTVYKLNRDMISFDGPPVEFKLKEFREGIVVFKRAGKYYFMWSIDDARSPNYRVGWGIADSPFGPVKSPEKDFIVLQKNGPAVATAHHGVVNVPGTDRWYVAYHRHAIPDGSGYQREVCLARMEFNADGSIKPMDPMTTPFQPGDAGEPVTSCVLDPEKSQGVWDGWGASLCWFANVFGDRDDVAAMLFSTQNVQLDDQSLPGLGLNIVRYNAGACSTNAVDGQEIVLSRAIPGWKQIEGFWLDGKSEDPQHCKLELVGGCETARLDDQSAGTWRRPVRAVLQLPYVVDARKPQSLGRRKSHRQQSPAGKLREIRGLPGDDSEARQGQLGHHFHHRRAIQRALLGLLVGEKRAGGLPFFPSGPGGGAQAFARRIERTRIDGNGDRGVRRKQIRLGRGDVEQLRLRHQGTD